MPKKGYKQTQEHVEKCRKPKFGNKIRLGLSSWNKGRKGTFNPTEEQRLKMSKNSYKRKMYLAKLNGAEDFNWQTKTYTNRQEIQEKIAGRPKPEYCEVCGRAGRICFDHNHTTGKFRGWLCVKCNCTLGFVGDSKEIFEKLIDYLEKNK